MKDDEDYEYCIECYRKLTKYNKGTEGDKCKICEQGEEITGGI